MEAKKEKNIIKFNNKRNLRSLFFSAAKNNTKIYRREIPSLRSFPAGCCVCLKSHSVTKLQSVIKRAQKKNLERDPGWDRREKKLRQREGKEVGGLQRKTYHQNTIAVIIVSTESFEWERDPKSLFLFARRLLDTNSICCYLNKY